MDVLQRGLASEQGTVWWGEANLGGWYTDEEVEAAVSSIRTSMDWRVGFGFGKDIEDFEEAFAAYCGARHAVALNSCGTALDLLMRCLDLEPGDEVICPAVNYKAAHLAILGQGGRVVFCDIDPATCNTDVEDVARRLTPRTRAIFPVHMNGLSAPMEELLDLASRHPHPTHGPPKVLGDAARSCGAARDGRRVGSVGWANAFSFHTQKLMTTLGEGGAVTTNDDALAARLRRLRHYGGESEWGSNYRMTTVQAAVGKVQVRRLDGMNDRRVRLAEKRHRLFERFPGLSVPFAPPGYRHVYYVYGLLLPVGTSAGERDGLIGTLRERHNIVCSVSNPPTYERWSFIREACGNGALLASEDVGRRLICLPIHPCMSEKEDDFICAAFLETAGSLLKI